jgi:hypothetical protein
VNTVEEVTLDLMEDVWEGLHLTPEVVVEDTGRETSGIYVKLTDDIDPGLVYYLDNGWDCLPDGVSLRALYSGPQGREVFRANNPSGDRLGWQQKAVEPLLVALRTDMATFRAALPDNVWQEFQERKQA